MNFITNSILLDGQTRELLQSNEQLYFSGRPIRHQKDEKVRTFDECEIVFDAVMLVRRAVVQFSQNLRAPNSRGTCSGDFIAIIGNPIERDVVVEDETYTFGMYPGYEFEMRISPSITE